MKKFVLLIFSITVLVFGATTMGCSDDKSTADETAESNVKQWRLDNMNRELKNMRLAMTALMADTGTMTVTPQYEWTNDVSAAIAPGPDGSLSIYLKRADSMAFYYQWDSDGTVRQCMDTKCPDPF